MNGEDAEQTGTVFYQFEIKKTSSLRQRLSLHPFDFSPGTGTDPCYHSPGWKGE